MKQVEIDQTCDLVRRCAYNQVNKDKWKRLSRKLMKEVAEALAMPKGSFDLRYSAAGIACSGDTTLHHERVYVQANADGICDWILVRTCQGRKDYTGGQNRSYTFEQLRREGALGLARFVAEVMR
jgi:hypothetical protein